MVDSSMAANDFKGDHPAFSPPSPGVLMDSAETLHRTTDGGLTAAACFFGSGETHGRGGF